MMKTSRDYMEKMRLHAGRQLAQGFALRVIEEAKKRRRVRIQLRLITITGLVCVLTTVSFHFVRTQLVQRQNLQGWAETAAKVRVLEETI